MKTSAPASLAESVGAWNPDLDHMRQMRRAIAAMEAVLREADQSNLRPDTRSHAIRLTRLVKEAGGWDRFSAWVEKMAAETGGRS